MARFWRWLAIAGVVVFSGVAVVSFGTAAYAAWLFHDLPDANRIAEYRPPTSTRVFAWDGTLIGEFGRERRIFVPYAQIPPQLRLAFLAAEDHNFFQHAGVDPVGVLRAGLRAPGDMAAGRRVEGASTITQQVARNILLTGERTFTRKLREAIIAARLETVLSKEQILELYLNEIWLGYRSYGVAAAAYNYFGKSLDQLTLGEMAFLAGLPKGPDLYQPVRRHEQAVARRNLVLYQMLDQGWITRADYEAARAEPLTVQPGPARTQYRDADYFVEQVRRDAIARFGTQVDEGGLYIRTTLDPTIQTQMRIAVQDGLERYDRRHGWRGATLNLSIDGNWARTAEAQMPGPVERTEWRRAIIINTSGRVRLADGTEGTINGGDLGWARAGRGLRVGDVIFVDPNGWRLKQIPAANAAMVAIDPRTGRTLGMVGGYSFSLSSFNRATQAQRQPGSSFKPFVYAAGLENGLTPASIILDAPLNVGGWRPQNYSRGRFYGPSTLRTGLTFSRNVMTVRIALRAGLQEVRSTAVRMGVADAMPNNYTIALGGGEVTPFRLVGAYSAFANGGLRVEPHLMEEIEDREGDAMLRADRRACRRCTSPLDAQGSPRLQPIGVQVIDPITAYQVTSMLQDVVRRGTAASAAFLGHHIAGKTGTTDEYRSAWFVGYTPDIVVGIFIGRDDNQTLGHGEAGASAALPFFIDFMRQHLQGVPDRDFEPPANAEFHVVQGHNEAFRPGSLNPTNSALRNVAPPPPGVRRGGGGSLLNGLPRNGPIPYSQLGPLGAPRPATPANPRPDAAPPPAQPRQTTPDLNGLY